MGERKIKRLASIVGQIDTHTVGRDDCVGKCDVKMYQSRGRKEEESVAGSLDMARIVTGRPEHYLKQRSIPFRFNRFR